MFNIYSLLQKFTKKILSAELSKKEIASIIEKRTNLSISPESLEIKNYILHIETSPVFKNKIFIQKRAILSDIALLSTEKIVDVK